ncbi:MAG: DNA-binding protein [Sulfuritalea sp.]|nr:DNA-binding protein [Sulfuritalea sp.]
MQTTILDVIDALCLEGVAPTVRNVCARARKSARDVTPVLAAWRRRTQTQDSATIQEKRIEELEHQVEIQSREAMVALASAKGDAAAPLERRIRELEQQLAQAAADLATARADAEASFEANRRWLMEQTDKIRQDALVDVRYWKEEASRLRAALNARKAELRAESWALLDPKGLLPNVDQAKS